MEENINKIVEAIKTKIGEKIVLEESEKKEGKRFFISDTHFNDERLNLYGRDLLFKNAKEVNDCIVEKWNNIVNKNDTVYHLGDVSMDLEGLNILNQLNGHKILIKGNYDVNTKDGGTAKYEINDKILLKYFDKVYDDLEIEIGGETVYLNHYPTNARENLFNITAHIHGLWKCQRNLVNVGVDAWHFTPVSEDLIKFQINGIRVHYDQNVFAGELKANILHRKGEVVVLRAPEEYKVAAFEECKDVFVFLAGPIDGTSKENMWQEYFIKEMQEKLKSIKTNRNIVICSPRRLEKPKNFIYEEQVNWESENLEKSAKQGILVFWLAKEMEKIEGRSFARTTRVELGEWLAKGKMIDNFKIVVGYEKGFDGFEYIEKKLNDTYPGNEMKKNKDDMVNEIVKQIKELIKK